MKSVSSTAAILGFAFGAAWATWGLGWAALCLLTAALFAGTAAIARGELGASGRTPPGRGSPPPPDAAAECACAWGPAPIFSRSGQRDPCVHSTLEFPGNTCNRV